MSALAPHAVSDFHLGWRLLADGVAEPTKLPGRVTCRFNGAHAPAVAFAEAGSSPNFHTAMPSFLALSARLPWDAAAGKRHDANR
jgi:hypothetical protein